MSVAEPKCLAFSYHCQFLLVHIHTGLCMCEKWYFSCDEQASGRTLLVIFSGSIGDICLTTNKEKATIILTSTTPAFTTAASTIIALTTRPSDAGPRRGVDSSVSSVVTGPLLFNGDLVMPIPRVEAPALPVRAIGVCVSTGLLFASLKHAGQAF